MTARLGWRPETEDLFTAVAASCDGRHFLVVERLPDGGWDWAAWGAERRNAQCVHGTAPTAAQGMVAAEQAAAMLGAGSIAPDQVPCRACG